MNKELKKIQKKLINNLERLDKETENIEKEVARSNSISQLANTYIKSCNLIIRIEENKTDVKSKIKSVLNSEK